MRGSRQSGSQLSRSPAHPLGLYELRPLLRFPQLQDAHSGARRRVKKSSAATRIFKDSALEQGVTRDAPMECPVPCVWAKGIPRPGLT